MIPLKCTYPFALCRISLPIHWLCRNVFILEPSLVSGRDSVHAGGNIDDQRNTSQHKIRQHILHSCRGHPNQLSCWTHQSSLCFTFLTEISWPYFIVFDDQFKRLLSAHTYPLVTFTLHCRSSFPIHSELSFLDFETSTWCRCTINRKQSLLGFLNRKKKFFYSAAQLYSLWMVGNYDMSEKEEFISRGLLYNLYLLFVL